jgi:hypothetical protein
VRAFVAEGPFGPRGLCAGDLAKIYLKASGSGPTNSIALWIVVCLSSACVQTTTYGSSSQCAWTECKLQRT